MTILMIAIIALIIIFFVLFPSARTLFKGFGNKFIQDTAGTPEGAEATYIAAIEKARDRYSRCQQHHNNISGKLSRANKSLEIAKVDKDRVEKTIERCFQEGREKDAIILRADYEIAIENIKTYEKVVAELTPLKAEAADVQEKAEFDLKKLEQEKKMVVAKMKLHKDSAEIYEGLDKLASNDSTDRLLKSVREKADNLEDRSVGARDVHNSKTSTKAEKLKKEMGSTEANDFMAQMQEKYKK